MIPKPALHNCIARESIAHKKLRKVALNYNTRLENVRKRKHDGVLNEAFVSKNFSTSSLPKNIKYLLEAVRPIGEISNTRTRKAAQYAQGHLESGLDLHFGRDYELQGSLETDTNIEVSDVDLLTIVGRYYFIQPGTPNDNPYTESDPDEDIKNLRKQAIGILESTYDIVMVKDKCVRIFNKNLGRFVDVVFAFWHHTPEYKRTGRRFYRGVKIGSRNASADYPFAHIENVNAKGAATNDGSKRAIRLLKTLKEDCETISIENVSSFHLTTIVHNMNDADLMFSMAYSADYIIAKNVSTMLSKVISDSNFRNSLQSPNGTEKPFVGKNVVEELNAIKTDLDELIRDVEKEIQNSFQTKSKILLY